MRSYILNLLVFISYFGTAQISWLPLDEQPDFDPIATFSSSSDLLALEAINSIGFREATLRLNRWNGQFWVKYPEIKVNQFVYSNNAKFSVTYHQNMPCIAGSFQTKDGAGFGIVGWNGVKWEVLGGGIESDYLIHKEISINKMLSYKGSLFVCGQFNIASGKPVHNFVVLKGGVWNTIETGHGRINDLYVANDTLYAAGLFDTIEGKPAVNLAAYFNGVWYPRYAPDQNQILALHSLDSSLVCVYKNSVFKRNQSGWTELNSQWNYEVVSIYSIAALDKKLTLSGIFKRSGSTTLNLLQWDGKQWLEMAKETDLGKTKNLPFFIEVVDKELVLSGPIFSLYNKKAPSFIRLLPGKTILQGKIYLDKTKNCQFDPEDLPLQNILLKLNNRYYTSSDTNGNYSLVLEPSSVSGIKIIPNSMYGLVCQNDSNWIQTTNRDSSILHDFSLFILPQPTIPEADIISASGFKARHGYTTHYKINYQAPQHLFPIYLELRYDKRLSYTSGSIEPEKTDSGFLRWVVTNQGQLHLNLFVNPDLISVGETLPFYLNARSIFEPQGIAETIKLLQTVSSAYDPNQKQCHRSQIEEGEMQLEYQIQFQNLGNDSAVNIHIVDTIDHKLPIEYIKMRDYSELHKNTVSFKVRNRAIIWHFKDIYLPCKSMAGNELSSGHIHYGSVLNEGLKIGSIIQNKASIYFDYQDAVVTNTVFTEIIKRSTPLPKTAMGMVQIYPNPLLDRTLTLSSSSYLMNKIEIIDLSGKNLYSISIQPSNKFSVQLPVLSQGMYIINISHTVGIYSQKLFIGRN